MCFFAEQAVYNGAIHDIRVLHDFLPLFFFFLGFGLLRFTVSEFWSFSLNVLFYHFFTVFPTLDWTLLSYYVISDLNLIMHQIAIDSCTLSFTIYNHVRTNCYMPSFYFNHQFIYIYIYIYIYIERERERERERDVCVELNCSISRFKSKINSLFNFFLMDLCFAFSSGRSTMWFEASLIFEKAILGSDWN